MPSSGTEGMEANSGIFSFTVIGRRLILLMMSVALAGVLVATAVLLGAFGVQARIQNTQQMNAIASRVATDYLAASNQGKGDPSVEAFRTVRGKPYLLSASILSPEGTTLAVFERDSAPGPLDQPSGRAEKYQWVCPILSAGRTNLVVHLIAEGPLPFGVIHLPAGTILLAGLLGLGVATALAVLLQKPLSERIARLQRFAERVVTEKDHSLRAEPGVGWQLGGLTANVNVIVSRVEEGEKSAQETGRQLDEQARKCEEARAALAAQEQARKEFQLNRDKLLATLRSMPEGVIVTDREAKIVLVNRAAERLTGWGSGEALSLPVEVAFLPERAGERIPGNTLVNSVLGGEPSAVLPEGCVLLSRSGTSRAISASAAPIEDEASQCLGAILLFRDVSQERREMAQQQSESRMEAVTEMASGIAHNFNNVLTVILGNLEFARSCADADPQLAEALDSATQASLQAREITRRVLSLTSRGSTSKKTSDLNGLIRQRVGFILDSALVRCHFNLADDLWEVEINPGQIEQAIEQLVQNAVQAMPSGGELHVISQNVLPEELAKLPLAQGRYVRLTIRDSGKGITAADLQRVFDPFFTTRARSTGLGLTCVYHILRKHGGLITADSVVGQGASFHIYLPAAGNQPKNGRPAQPARAAQA